MSWPQIQEQVFFRRLLTAIVFSLCFGVGWTFGGFNADASKLNWVTSAQADIPPEQMTRDKMPEDGLTFHYLKRYQPAIDILAREAPGLRERAQKNLGVDELSPIDVWVLPRVADYYSLRDEPNRAPEWAVGLSLSNRSTIIVAHGGARPPEEVMFTYAHELAHVAVDQARGEAPVPRWFHEGFAVMMAQEWTPERSEKLSQAAARGQLQPFSKLRRSFPSHQQSVSLAYDQSFHFVRWLQLEYGADFWARVMHQMDRGHTFEQSLEGESGSSITQLEARWREELSDSSSFWSIFADENIIFFGVSLLFILAYIRARRRRRRQLESMKDDKVADGGYDRAHYPLPGD